MRIGWGEVETLVRDQRVLTVTLTGDGYYGHSVDDSTYRKFTKSRHTKRRGRRAHSSAQIVKEMCIKG